MSGKEDDSAESAYIRESGIEMAALRQLAFGLAPDDPESYDTLIDGVHAALDHHDAIQEENERLREKLADLDDRVERLGDIGEEKTSKEQKIVAIVTYADNARREGQSVVTMTPENITGAAGVGRRYAYDLVDDMIEGDGEGGTVGPEGYDWAHDPRDLPRHVEQDTPNKGVAIDFEGVHGTSVSVNKFTTRSGGQGVAD
jgi:hypothetical protein